MKYFAVILLIAMGCFDIHAASSKDVDRLTTIAAIYGRAIGCGMSTSDNMSKTGAWIDSTFNAEERSYYLEIFMDSVKFNAERQSQGQTGDSCSDVKLQYSRINF